ncbi:MAG: hypothetical protein AAGE84_09640 [Cyanobacteria bacterium P01_G01_bin.39]
MDMDVELQILKHIKRSPTPTVSIIDRYCSAYNDLFSDVRIFVRGTGANLYKFEKSVNNKKERNKYKLRPQSNI